MKNIRILFVTIFFSMLSTLLSAQGTLNKSDKTKSHIELPGNRQTPRNRSVIEPGPYNLAKWTIQKLVKQNDRKRQYSPARSLISLTESEALSNDSAYLYHWNDISKEWELYQRLYYLFTNTSIEIVEENHIPESNGWETYRKTIREYANSGRFIKEYESYWKESTKEWVIGYYDERNTAGKRIEFYTRNWNDTSNMFTDGFRIVSSYENDTNLVEQLIQEWELTTKSWTNNVQTVNNYNSNGLRTSTTDKIWNASDNSWVNNFTISFDYNEFNELISEKSEIWDTIENEWVNDIYISLEYDELGNLSKEQIQEWDTLEGLWTNISQSNYMYNDFFQPETDLIKIWNKESNTWEDSLKASYTYNNNGGLLEYLEEKNISGGWQNEYRERYTYNEQNILSTIDFEFWNTDDIDWAFHSRVTLEYDEALQYILSEKQEYWNSELKTWETGYLDKYDIFGNNIEYFEKVWNDTLNRFIEGFRFTSAFFSNGLIAEQSTQLWDSLDYSWVNDQKITFFWEETSSVSEIDETYGFSVYPVPVQDQVFIEYNKDQGLRISKLSIFSMNGRMIREIKLGDYSGEAINLEFLGKGTYIFVFTSDKMNVVKEIVKF